MHRLCRKRSTPSCTRRDDGPLEKSWELDVSDSIVSVFPLR